MNKHKLLVFATLALVLLLGVLAVEAGDQKLPAPRKITFTYRWVQTLQPGKFWVDETGSHIRERVDLVSLNGSVSGSAIVVYNADMAQRYDPTQSDPFLPILPGDGEAYGTISIYDDSDEKPAPGWTGDWGHKIVNGEVVGGGMTAVSRDRTWLMQISSITQSERQTLIYSGMIQYNCLELPCFTTQDRFTATTGAFDRFTSTTGMGH